MIGAPHAPWTTTPRSFPLLTLHHRRLHVCGLFSSTRPLAVRAQVLRAQLLRMGKENETGRARHAELQASCLPPPLH